MTIDLARMPLADLQKLEAEYTQRAAAKGGKVAGVHQAVRNEIASRGVPAQQHASAPRRAVELAATHSGYRPPIGKPGKWQPLGPMKAATGKSMHKLAGQLKDRHPGIGTHQHVTDAAHALDRGDHDAAIRHLNAGIANLTPQSLLRHGFTNDADHIQAKISMDDIHRHLLLVKDIQESAARNQELVKAQVPATQEDEIAKPPGAQQPPAAAPGPKQPTPPPAPGAAAKPTPPAPGTAGPAPAPAVASTPQPGTGGKPPPKAVAASNGEVTTAIELIGPKGSSHGWQQQTPTAGDHEKAARLHLRAAKAAKNPVAKAKHVKMAVVHQQVAAKLRTVNGTAAAAEGGSGGDRVNGAEQELAGEPTDILDMALFRHFNPAELRGKHGEWVSSGELAGHAARDIPEPGGGVKTMSGQLLDERDRARDAALRAARGGEPHKAGRILRASAAGGNAYGTDQGYADKARTYADAFSRLPDDSPDEVARENKFLIHHAAHPKLMEEEAAKQATALDRAGAKSDPGGHIGKAADSLRAMDFDSAAAHLADARSQVVGYSPQGARAQAALAAARERALRAAAYSDDMKTYGLYQSTVAAASEVTLAAAHRPYRFKHGWVPIEGGDTPEVGTRKDPPAITKPGGGRKNWMTRANQMPQRQVKKDYPDIARRMRQVTPERVQQAQLDETRIAGGLAPLHPELAQIFPATYGKHALSGPPLPLPKPERVKHDPSYVTGIVNPRIQPIISALRARNPSAYAFAEPVELSGKTGALATVPHPFGKPGGPGLWHQKGMELPPYVQNIAHAILRTGRAKTLGEAIAIAKGATSRWAKGGGKVKPEVRAASAATNADWDAKRARAHAHANAQRAIELVGPKGYIHGWIKVGSIEHKNLGEMIDGGQETGRHLDAAYAAAQRGDSGEMSRHLHRADDSIRRKGDPNTALNYKIGELMHQPDYENRMNSANNRHSQPPAPPAIRSG
jgi:hypothetical protein